MPRRMRTVVPNSAFVSHSFGPDVNAAPYSHRLAYLAVHGSASDCWQSFGKNLLRNAATDSECTTMWQSAIAAFTLMVLAMAAWGEMRRIPRPPKAIGAVACELPGCQPDADDAAERFSNG